MPDGFSLKPDKIVQKRGGVHKIVRDNPPRLLESATQGRIWYTPKDNKYWIAEDVECPKDRFESHFLPYLRWNFDQYVEEEVTAKDEKGTSVKLKTGRKASTFPPTPENIATKRQELLQEAMETGEDIDKMKIYDLTSPTMLKNHDLMEKELDEGPEYKKLARRLKNMSRY